MSISEPVPSFSAYQIRPAVVDDVQNLPLIEKSAGTSFQTCDDPQLQMLADDEPIASDLHRASIQLWHSHNIGAGGTWVAAIANASSQTRWDATNSSEIVVAFVKCRMVQIVDKVPQPLGTATNLDSYFIHIDELSVHKDHQRRGLASRLVETVKDTARQLRLVSSDSTPRGHHIVGVTLVTMRQVPFNGPFYEKLGFEFFSEHPECEIASEGGTKALDIWSEDLDIFRHKGDGSLVKQRCWMQYLCPE